MFWYNIYNWKINELIKINKLEWKIVLYGEVPVSKIDFKSIKTSIAIFSSKAEWQYLYDSIMLWNAVCASDIPSFNWILNNSLLKHPVWDYKKLALNIMRYMNNTKKRTEAIKLNQKIIIQNYNFILSYI